MNNLQRLVIIVPSLIVLIAFLVTIMFCFPNGNVLPQNGRLMKFWIIPGIFLMTVASLNQISESETIPRWVLFLGSNLAIGASAGLSFGAFLILNDWYANPDNSLYEPLFTATGLSGAGVLSAQRWLEQVRKKQ